MNRRERNQRDGRVADAIGTGAFIGNPSVATATFVFLTTLVAAAFSLLFVGGARLVGAGVRTAWRGGRRAAHRGDGLA